MSVIRNSVHILDLWTMCRLLLRHGIERNVIK